MSDEESTDEFDDAMEDSGTQPLTNENEVEKTNAETDTSTKPFACPKCDKQFDEEEDLKAHECPKTGQETPETNPESKSDDKV